MRRRHAARPSPPRPGASRALAAAAAVAAAAFGYGALPAGTAFADGSLIEIDNSEADSWLEVDRTANLENGDGTAGSDHDGSAVDVIDTLVNRDVPDEEDDGDGEGAA
ncbi:hypothetical protein [Streptomyces sp. NPDC050560]|uniref:hypothetical protein n=1 Tax=Streptomyces sp. NPDC050560 TaxID=3365630 RepID=UPI0037A82239